MEDILADGAVMSRVTFIICDIIKDHLIGEWVEFITRLNKSSS